MSARTRTIHGSGTAQRRSFTERLARASATHPWRTLAIWAAVITVAVVAMGPLLGSGLTSTAKMHGKLPDSTVGMNLIQERLTGPQRSTDFVIVRSADSTVGQPAFKAYVVGLTSKISALGPSVVAAVTTYYQSADPGLISKDRHSMLVPVVMAGTVDQAVKNVDKLRAVVVAGGAPGFTLAQTGDASINEMFTKLSKRTSSAARSLACRRP
jgi:uncharacterized membrane protein YdfJ with MMPL/SSD domain